MLAIPFLHQIVNNPALLSIAAQAIDDLRRDIISGYNQNGIYGVRNVIIQHVAEYAAFGMAVKGAEFVIKTGANFLERKAAHVINTTPLYKSLNSLRLSPSRRSVMRKIERNIKSIDEFIALKNPLFVHAPKTDFFGLLSQRFIREYAEIFINPVSRKIISVNPTKSRKREALLKRKGEL